MRRGVWVWLVVLAGCDEGALPAGWEVRGSPDALDNTAAADTTVDDVAVITSPCPVADQVFTPLCVSCHDGSRFPDLRAGALGRLADLPSLAYPGQTIVTPDDPEASLLFLKMHAGSGFGAFMPPDADPSDEQVAAVATWINQGAPACTNAEDPGPVDPPTYEPGGDITFGALPTGFQTTQPAWSEDGHCTAQQWWKYEGNHESTSMHPGRACIDCHTREHEGPTFTYAGTVFPNVAEASDCRGVAGVKVEILDNDGHPLGTATTTNAAGNFYWQRAQLAFSPGYRARLTFDGRTREMTLPQSGSGDCNTCHASTGTDGAPGRMVVP